ncbi:hypothetical protein [Bacillus thuringiensis]|uniref:hypothetical protein n=1 Tax=Bacillus thuringiensis TaxID=1428 RepID=UPI000BFD4ED3|nr:hypothetical protein [Bacillus thuringiensis]PGH92547.1 hypothetical protein CN898_26790 [Bacillus thuringiensis]
MGQKMPVDIICNTGHMVAKMRIVAEHLHAMADELSTVEDDYCMNDGGVLEEIYSEGVLIKKKCSKCEEEYVLKK